MTWLPHFRFTPSPGRCRPAGLGAVIHLGAPILLVGFGLSACAPSPPPPSPPAPVLTLNPLPSARVIDQAEALAYNEGIAAGKRIQVEHDQVVIAAAANAARPYCPVVARPVTAAPTPPPVTQPQEPPASVYVPGGPAVPVGGVQ